RSSPSALTHTARSPRSTLFPYTTLFRSDRDVRVEQVVLLALWPHEVIDVGSAQGRAEGAGRGAVVVLDGAGIRADRERGVGEPTAEAAPYLLALHREHVLAGLVDLLLVLNRAAVEGGVQVRVGLRHSVLDEVVVGQGGRQRGDPADRLDVLPRDGHRRDLREPLPHCLLDGGVRQEGNRIEQHPPSETAAGVFSL